MLFFFVPTILRVVCVVSPIVVDEVIPLLTIFRSLQRRVNIDTCRLLTWSLQRVSDLPLLLRLGTLSTANIFSDILKYDAQTKSFIFYGEISGETG